MLEAYYKEERDLSVGPKIKQRHVRLIFQVMMGAGALAFWGVGISTMIDSSGWHDSFTGEAVSRTAGILLGLLFFGFGFVFGLFAWLGGRMPIMWNDRPMEEDLPTGLAWQLSAAGLANPAWTDETIPWSAFSRAEEDDDSSGRICVNLYFTDRAAVALHMGKHEAEDWNAGVGYTLPVALTTASIEQVRGALDELRPDLMKKA
jgi:hypothetical protein